MSDLLTRMTERTLGLVPTLQPKLTSTYESSPMLGDGLAAAYAPDVMEDPSAGLATEPTGITAQTNTVVPRGNVPTPMVVAAQPNLVISRLSHNLSGIVWPDAPSPVTVSDPTAAPVTSIDSSVSEMIVTPAASLGITNLAIEAINSPTLLASPPTIPEFSKEIAQPLTRADLVPQFSAPLPVTTNSPTPDQIELITKSELITIRENSAPIAAPSSSSPLPIGMPVNLVTTATPMPTTNQTNLTPAITSETAEAIALQPPSPSRERLVTQISTANPVATNQSLVSVPDRKAGQTLVPIAIRPLDSFGNRLLSTPVTQISSPPAPTIQVKIGRIEIRAVTTPPPAAPPKSRPSSSVPQLSLADYLKSRGSST
jgi:hypothetical protein